MNPFTLSQIPMSVLKRKLKQVSSGMGIAALFLMAGMAAGGPVEIPGKVRADTIVCAPETTAPQARTEAEPENDTRLAARTAMRMPYFSFGNLLPRSAALINTVGP